MRSLAKTAIDTTGSRQEGNVVCGGGEQYVAPIQSHHTEDPESSGCGLDMGQAWSGSL